MNILNKQQAKIVASIKEELQLDRPSGMFHSVWFAPQIGVFLYADFAVKHEVMQPLIENGLFVYKGLEKHQGEKMPRYVLSDEYLKK